MDSATYCKQAIGTLRDGQDGSFSGPGSHQTVIALSSLGQQGLSARDFTRALSLLFESSERPRQPKLAEAARRILGDRQARSAGR